MNACLQLNNRTRTTTQAPLARILFKANGQVSIHSKVLSQDDLLLLATTLAGRWVNLTCGDQVRLDSTECRAIRCYAEALTAPC